MPARRDIPPQPSPATIWLLRRRRPCRLPMPHMPRGTWGAAPRSHPARSNLPFCRHESSATGVVKRRRGLASPARSNQHSSSLSGVEVKGRAPAGRLIAATPSRPPASTIAGSRVHRVAMTVHAGGSEVWQHELVFRGSDSYSSCRRIQNPVSLRPRGARSSHWYVVHSASNPRA